MWPADPALLVTRAVGLALTLLLWPATVGLRWYARWSEPSEGPWDSD